MEAADHRVWSPTCKAPSCRHQKGGGWIRRHNSLNSPFLSRLCMKKIPLVCVCEQPLWRLHHRLQKERTAPAAPLPSEVPDLQIWLRDGFTRCHQHEFRFDILLCMIAWLVGCRDCMQLETIPHAYSHRLSSMSHFAFLFFVAAWPRLLRTLFGSISALDPLSGSAPSAVSPGWMFLLRGLMRRRFSQTTPQAMRLADFAGVCQLVAFWSRSIQLTTSEVQLCRNSMLPCGHFRPGAPAPPPKLLAAGQWFLGGSLSGRSNAYHSQGLAIGTYSRHEAQVHWPLCDLVPVRA